MKRIYIVGGDGFARECARCLLELCEDDANLVFAGFLGHNGYRVDYKNLDHLFQGDLSAHIFTEDEYCIIGAGYPELRRKIYNDIKKQGGKFYTLIARGCILNPQFEYGEANVFFREFEPTVQIKIGTGNVFNGGVVIGHDVNVGDFNFFGPRSMLLGNVTVGSDNIVGSCAVLLPHAKIGDFNKIAPLSAVYKGCRSYCYMLGNPALKVGTAED